MAIIRFQLVCTGSDDTELFSNHHLDVERQQALAGLGTSASDGMSILFLNWEFPATPLWQQCP